MDVHRIWKKGENTPRPQRPAGGGGGRTEMIKTQKMSALLLDERDRAAGEFVNEAGKLVVYAAARFLTVLPVGKNDEMRELKIRHSVIPAVEKLTESLHWGALLALTVEKDEIVDVEVEADPFAAYFEAEV